MQIFEKIVSILLNYYYLFIIHFNKSNCIVICDIDNTIADSVSEFGLFIPFKIRPKIEPVIRFVKDQKSCDCALFFFTVRPIASYWETFQWLRKNGFEDLSYFQLFMARMPMQKVNLLKKLKSKKIIYIDDMSYGHELQHIQLYEDEITEVRSIPNVVYYDNNFLIKLKLT
jgi:hypothetical protein